MPRAHLCTSCGEDLALIAPQREPHYGWPLLRCPTCCAPSVRWEGHERSTWRRWRKRAKAVAGVIGRVGVFALLTILTLSATAALSEETRSLRMSARLPGPLALLGLSRSGTGGEGGDAARAGFLDQRFNWFDNGSNIFLVAGWTFSAVLAGVFLAVLLRHRRWFITIPLWGAWMFGVWAMAFIAVPIIGSWIAPEETHWKGLLAKSLIDAADLAAWCAAFVVVGFATSPLALVARGTVRSLIHRQRWRIRKRIRKWRQTA